MTGPMVPLIVMDLEWTAWKGSRQRLWTGPGEEMEIVQIGAVKLADTEDLAELDAFEILVRPRINPRLDSYFTELTGITQDDLDRDGVDLKDALAAFAAFTEPARMFLGFGDELSHIIKNCQLYGMANPLARCHCANVQRPVMEQLNTAQVPNSSDLPGLMGFTPPGAMHQGLADSRCVTEALRQLRAAGRF